MGKYYIYRVKRSRNKLKTVAYIGWIRRWKHFHIIVEIKAMSHHWGGQTQAAIISLWPSQGTTDLFKSMFGKAQWSTEVQSPLCHVIKSFVTLNYAHLTNCVCDSCVDAMDVHWWQCRIHLKEAGAKQSRSWWLFPTEEEETHILSS